MALAAADRLLVGGPGTRVASTAGISVSNVTTETVIATLTFQQVTGRVYEVLAIISGAVSATTATVSLSVRENNISGVFVQQLSSMTIPSTGTRTIHIIREYVANETGQKTLVVTAACSGGDFDVFSSNSRYSVKCVDE